VACSDLVSDNETSSSFGLGILFVCLKAIMSVSKGMTQELFMQEADLSATLLLGMEGMYGVLMAVPYIFSSAQSLVTNRSRLSRALASRH
jgi:hypothetical protein